MKDYPITQAVRFLRERQITFAPHLYEYEEKGGTSRSARELGVAEHAVIKTLVMEDERKRPLVVLMHGDFEVSTKALARHLGVKSIAPCAPQVADKHSGYQVGGTSPFGLRTKMPIYAEASIFDLETIYINGGKRGFLISLAPQVLGHELGAVPVNVAVPKL
jgi:Cys-tRNA(Pro) deacylase